MAPDWSGYPYEFETSDGVPVRLHDMAYEGFEFRVLPPTLVLRFRYDDPEWTPPTATATPVAVFTFTGVQVWQWEDEHDMFETPEAYRSQVRDLGWYAPTNTFSLETITTTLLFAADQLAVHLEPLPPAG